MTATDILIYVIIVLIGLAAGDAIAVLAHWHSRS
jgi:hypothetical protein